MAEFDFEIEHRSGKDHVVPDTLSRAPIPEPSTVGDNLIIPPASVDSFLIMALGLDIPFIDSSSVSEVFNDALQCITLSCSPTNPNRFSSRNSKLLTNGPSVHISTTIPDTPPPIPPPLQVQTPPVIPQWSSDLETLHPLNISCTNFAQKQCQDTWLGPLFQYLNEEENVSVLTTLPKNVSSYVGELPVSPNGNKWILTAVCPFSNYLRTIPVPDKTATTAANALFTGIFLLLGFPSVLQSDRGGEWLNALLHRLTKLLSIKHVFTSGFCPRLNSVTERTHRFLNASLGIYCERQQKKWEEYLQPTVYAHNTSPISGVSDVTPFFLVFGRDAPAPETISLKLPPKPLPPDHYAKHIVSRMQHAHKQFSQIKADLRRTQQESYNSKARILSIPDSKIVYICNDSPSRIRGQATRFIRNFDGPYLVIGHPYGRNDLLTLRHIRSGNNISHPVNIEKVVVIPEPEQHDLQPPNEAVVENEIDSDSTSKVDKVPISADLTCVAHEFGKYLNLLASKSSTVSQACKIVYQQYPQFREILARHGRLKGLVKFCLFLQMDGEVSGGTYILSLNQTLFKQVDFLMSGIRICATDQGRFFTSKNLGQAPNFKLFSRTGSNF